MQICLDTAGGRASNPLSPSLQMDDDDGGGENNNDYLSRKRQKEQASYIYRAGIQKLGPRLRELAPVARGRQEAGFTQPRAHLIAHLLRFRTNGLRMGLELGSQSAIQHFSFSSVSFCPIEGARRNFSPLFVHSNFISGS